MPAGTALVTGGAGIIGAAICDALAQEGWSVRLVDREEALRTFETPAGMRADALDITDIAACRAYFAALTELAVLVNCAGIAKLSPLRQMDLDVWRQVLEVNVTAPLALTQLAAPLLARSGHGAIVNVASIAGHRAGFGRVAYGTSKAAILHLTRQAALELAPLGIRCNSVAPGPVESRMLREALPPEDFDDYVGGIPQARFARPEEVADAVAFLSSEKSSHVTGHCLAVDGGWLAAGAGIRRAQKLTL